MNSGHLRQSRTEQDGRNERRHDGSLVDDVIMAFAEKITQSTHSIKL